MKATKICAYCGKEFVPNYPTRKYCSDECARLINSDKSREYFQTVGKYKKAERKRRKLELERQRKNGMNLSEIARQVKAAGMSYAEYQKQETLERMARRA